jgi:hypothetical protein
MPNQNVMNLSRFVVAAQFDAVAFGQRTVRIFARGAGQRHFPKETARANSFPPR